MWYNTGVGACGHWNGEDELVVAVSIPVFGLAANPNTSPSCNRWVHLDYNNRHVDVKVVEKCWNCKYGDLDLSPGAFRALGLDTNHGRYYGARWWWSFCSDQRPGC
jgi:hypothetical protein